MVPCIRCGSPGVRGYFCDACKARAEAKMAFRQRLGRVEEVARLLFVAEFESKSSKHEDDQDTVSIVDALRRYGAPIDPLTRKCIAAAEVFIDSFDAWKKIIEEEANVAIEVQKRTSLCKEKKT